MLWGDEATAVIVSAPESASSSCTPRIYTFDYPFPPDEVVEFYRINYRPMSRAFASLDAKGQEELRE